MPPIREQIDNLPKRNFSGLRPFLKEFKTLSSRTQWDEERKVLELIDRLTYDLFQRVQDRSSFSPSIGLTVFCDRLLALDLYEDICFKPKTPRKGLVKSLYLKLSSGTGSLQSSFRRKAECIHQAQIKPALQISRTQRQIKKKRPTLNTIVG
ncbi:hypothetical protein BJ508DRAFT_347075 [Ascobolus immersus RN42]|uniref:Uncharacterized protein n=1 Tax=Ascobolus immersus RN42 TaxID=1160509 RepID=A0A3N4I3E8_ASCIM|nr:hypothetical protein BJ508DRAFT_347075 [Ascobolus immersus RN42]